MGKFYKRVMALLLTVFLLVELIPVGGFTITANTEENSGGYGSNESNGPGFFPSLPLKHIKQIKKSFNCKNNCTKMQTVN